MDYDVLMKQIREIDKNAYLVTINEAEYVDVSNCNAENVNKIESLQNVYYDKREEQIETVSADDYFYCESCNKNKWLTNGYTIYKRIVDDAYICTDCLYSAEYDNADLAERYFMDLVNNPEKANEFLSSRFLREHGFYRNNYSNYTVKFGMYSVNVHPEKILEAEQTKGNDVVFNVRYSSPFEAEYDYYVRRAKNEI